MRADPADFEYYERRLEALRQLPPASAKLTLDELGALAERLVFEISPSLDLLQVEQDLKTVDDLDIGALREATSLLAGFQLSDVPVTSERTISFNEELSKLQELIEELQDQQPSLHLREAWFRLEMLADRHLFYILLCAAAANADVSPLVERAREKLRHLPEVTLVTLWARVQREFERDGIGPPMRSDAPDVPPGFLNLGSAEELAHKLALYAFSIKPRLVVDRFNEGVYSYGLDSMGPARMLAINTNASTIGRELRTVDFSRAISRFSALWSTILNRQISELAELVGLPTKSRLLSGTQAKDASNAFKDVPMPERPALAVYELQHFILLVQRYSSPSSSLVQALMQHKLGLEVTLPESAARIAGKGELLLQKELCRFLLERGIYSEGTKFGPFEADLFAQVRAQAYILEAKLVTAAKPPTEAMVRGSLAQLQDYMDKRVVRPRGILVIYNLSDTLLNGPGLWLRGRYWVAAINLGTGTGSRRRRSLVIEERTGPELFAVHKIDEIPRAGRTKKKVARRAPRAR
ncbi:hypothetical protein [Sorangium sp. So ce388]|uniref:hypothetical protein n=1 Tax=Sorangium sp. So ce388 TaxID=3133309 RepID=UPI003F5C21A6